MPPKRRVPTSCSSASANAMLRFDSGVGGKKNAMPPFPKPLNPAFKVQRQVAYKELVDDDRRLLHKEAVRLYLTKRNLKVGTGCPEVQGFVMWCFDT